jgi:hypothetical protein
MNRCSVPRWRAIGTGFHRAMVATVVLCMTTSSVHAFSPSRHDQSSQVSTQVFANKPWNFFQFAQQSSKFVTLPFTSFKKQTVQPGDSLTVSMSPLDDVVMGGASSSSFDASTGTWSGQVTDDNNGGFVGIRSLPKEVWDMTHCQGLVWTVRSKTTGRFKFIARDSSDFNGITWSTSCNVEPGMNRVFVDFQKQIPALLARTVPTVTFDKGNVVGVQIAYSKFEYDGELNPYFKVGPVHLQLMELRAY